MFSPRLNGLKPLLVEDNRQVSLNSDNGGGDEVVMENPERRDGLPMMSVSIALN